MGERTQLHADHVAAVASADDECRVADLVVGDHMQGGESSEPLSDPVVVHGGALCGFAGREIVAHFAAPSAAVAITDVGDAAFDADLFDRGQMAEALAGEVGQSAHASISAMLGYSCGMQYGSQQVRYMSISCSVVVGSSWSRGESLDGGAHHACGGGGVC